MWFFRRDPWKKISRDLLRIINYIDTDAAVKLADQGNDDKAIEARMIAIRLATIFRDQPMIEQQVAQAEALLESQRANALANLHPNGIPVAEIEDERGRVDIRDQVYRAIISASTQRE